MVVWPVSRRDNRAGCGMVVDVKREREGKISCQATVRGAVFGGAGVTLLVVGVWRVDGVLAALGLSACGLWLLARFLGWINLIRLEVGFDGPEGVPAGVVFPGVLTLWNRRHGWDGYDLRLEMELPGNVRVGGRLAWVAAGSAGDLELRMAVPERGAYEGHRVRLESMFPLGLFEVRRVVGVEHSLLVYPRVLVPEGLRALGVLMDASPVDGASAGEAAGEPRGPRVWQPGDSPRRVDWVASVRSFARGMGLIVREADPPGYQPKRCMVMFHSFGSDGSLICPERFEQGLSMVAGVLRHFHGLGVPVRLVGDFDGWEEHPAATRAQLAVCQEVLARAVRARGTEAHDVQANALRVHEDEVLIVLSDMPVAGWRPVLPRLRLPVLTPALRQRRHRQRVAGR